MEPGAYPPGPGTKKPRKGKGGAAPAKAVHKGHWAVKVVAEGTYRISLRRWPVEADHPINAALPAGADVPGATKAFRANLGMAISAGKATLRIDGKDLETKPVPAGAKEVSFTTSLRRDPTSWRRCFTSSRVNSGPTTRS